MQRIELIGVTGVGKSTLVNALCLSQPGRGQSRFITPDDLVIDTSLSRRTSFLFRTLREQLLSGVDSLFANFVRRSLYRTYKSKAYEYAIWQWGKDYAVIQERWSRFVKLFNRGMQETTIPVTRFFIYWTLKAFAVAAIADSRADYDKTLLHDEGLG